MVAGRESTSSLAEQTEHAVHRFDVQQRLAALSALKADWDGAGTKPIDPRVLAAVRAFIAGTPHAVNRYLFIAPGRDGGLQLEWHRDQRGLEMEWTPNGRFGVLEIMGPPEVMREFEIDRWPDPSDHGLGAMIRRCVRLSSWR